jgi:hypothetical protein
MIQIGKILTCLGAAVLLGACGAAGERTVPVVEGEVAPELLAMCLADYRETYLKGREFRAEAKVCCSRLTQQEVRESLYMQWLRAPLTEAEYISLRISNLPPRFLGGAGHYLLSPVSGKIIARYHTK